MTRDGERNARLCRRAPLESSATIELGRSGRHEVSHSDLQRWIGRHILPITEPYQRNFGHLDNGELPRRRRTGNARLSLLRNGKPGSVFHGAPEGIVERYGFQGRKLVEALLARQSDDIRRRAVSAGVRLGATFIVRLASKSPGS